MSKLPGPHNYDPFSGIPPSRTPGALGFRDAADPSVIARLGDTPGPVGANDYAAFLARGGRTAGAPKKDVDARWQTFLDSLCDWKTVSGPRIAWESSAHVSITTDAVNSSFMREILPPRDARRRLLKILSELPMDVADTDITPEQGSDSSIGHKTLSQSGQATHFMANKGQSQRSAYAAGVEKIFGNAEKAVKLFQATDDVSDTTSRGTSAVDDVAVALGDSVHALQDSFSPVHVHRNKVGGRFLIMRIQVWSDQTWKEHKAGDSTWKKSDGGLTELGQACYEATKSLLAYFVLRAVNKSDEAEQHKRMLMSEWLSVADSSRSGWSP